MIKRKLTLILKQESLVKIDILRKLYNTDNWFWMGTIYQFMLFRPYRNNTSFASLALLTIWPNWTRLIAPVNSRLHKHAKLEMSPIQKHWTLRLRMENHVYQSILLLSGISVLLPTFLHSHSCIDLQSNWKVSRTSSQIITYRFLT